MRFTKLATMTGVVAALLIGTAGTGSAAGYNWDQPLVPSEKKNVNDNRDFSAQRTDGGSFLEINAAGNLIYWARSGESFVSQQRGSNWQNTRLITSLDVNRFLEVTGDNRLVLWKWNGSFYTAKQIGTNWGPARLLTGLESGAFLEINDQGLLRRWDIDTQTENIVGSEQIGSDWDETRAIAGKDYVDFIEIKGTNAVSEWYDFINDGRSLSEIQFEGADFTDVRLIVGTDFYHFLVILQDGRLYEFTLGEDGFYYQAQRGQDWNNTRLLG